MRTLRDSHLFLRNPTTSAYDITEAAESFTVDANGYASDTMRYDPAGNLTYDGVESYAYDAWNRLISVAHAYRDDGGTLHTGQVFETMTYDGQGRRMVKAITATGRFDCTYDYYYDHDKAVETRNGSVQRDYRHPRSTNQIGETGDCPELSQDKAVETRNGSAQRDYRHP